MQRFSRWQRPALRLAHTGWLILLVSVAVMIVGSSVVAVWNPDTDPPPADTTECQNPPCFGGGGMPGVADLPTVVAFVGSGMAILLGVPRALWGAWSVLRGRWRPGVPGLLAVVGPLLFVAGTELVPHVLNPCFAVELTGNDLPGFCERTESGADIGSRVHALHHAVFGALPMAVLYTRALRRWQPDVVKSQLRS